MQIWESLSVLCAQIAARGEGARESRCVNSRRGSPIEPPVITDESPLRNLGVYRSETNFYTISHNKSGCDRNNHFLAQVCSNLFSGKLKVRLGKTDFSTL